MITNSVAAASRNRRSFPSCYMLLLLMVVVLLLLLLLERDRQVVGARLCPEHDGKVNGPLDAVSTGGAACPTPLCQILSVGGT